MRGAHLHLEPGVAAALTPATDLPMLACTPIHGPGAPIRQLVACTVQRTGLQTRLFLPVGVARVGERVQSLMHGVVFWYCGSCLSGGSRHRRLRADGRDVLVVGLVGDAQAFAGLHAHPDAERQHRNADEGPMIVRLSSTPQIIGIQLYGCRTRGCSINFFFVV